MNLHPTIFLDRDGTLVHAYHYPSRPEHLRLYAHMGPGLRALQEKGFYLVVVTNQAGIARGYFNQDDLEHMHTYLRSELAAFGVCLDAIYYCPHHIEGIMPAFTRACTCRKPQPGMLLQAAHDLSIDLAHSWFVGDILDDVEAGNRAGCRTILVDLGTEQRPTSALRTPTLVAHNIVQALTMMNVLTTIDRKLDLFHQPERWSPEANEARPHVSVDAFEAISSISTEQRLCQQ